MSRKLTYLILVLSVSSSAFGARSARRVLLRDGFVLTAVDGKLVSHDSNEASQGQYIDFGIPDRWFFEFDSDVTDGIGLVKAGESLELLPSRGLERMTASLKQHPDATFRLYKGIVTKYKGRNFVFADYFLAIGKEKERPQPQETVQSPSKSQMQETKPIVAPPVPEQEHGVTINEPNDVLAIPPEIIEKLKARRILNPGRKKQTQEKAKAVKEEPDPTKDRRMELQPGRVPELKPDSVLVGRTALFRDVGRDVFVLDALGRNVLKVSLRLLPCQALEQAQQEQSVEPDPVRFKIAGIATEYKGNKYLLLQKATRVYSHKNFPR